MEVVNSNKCLRCGGSLRLIGKERKNGKAIANKTGKDWATRKYHKKCWKQKLYEDICLRAVEENELEI